VAEYGRGFGGREVAEAAFGDEEGGDVVAEGREEGGCGL
jgi:hypothetical protein